MFAWLAHFIERHPFLHRFALNIWRAFPPRLAGFMRGILSTNWTVGAVAVVLDMDSTPHEVLLVEHSYRTKGVWGLPGGSLESRLGDPLSPAQAESRDDVLESTLRREIFEELGIEVVILGLLRIDAVPYVPEEPGPYRLDFYYRCAPKMGFARLREGIEAGTIKPRSAEVRSLRMVPLSHLNELDLYSCDARLLFAHLPKILPKLAQDDDEYPRGFSTLTAGGTGFIRDERSQKN